MTTRGLLAAAWLLGALAAPGRAQEHAETAREAMRLIDEAQARWRALPGYVAVSRRTDKGTITTTAISVRREAGRTPLVRVEKSARRGYGKGKAKPLGLLLQNREGGWRIEGKRAIRLGTMPPLERQLPSRLPTGRALRLTGGPAAGRAAAVEYALERDVEWFGHRCARIRAVLPPGAMAAARQRLAEPAGGGAPGPADDPPEGRGNPRHAAIAWPVAHVYLIDQATGLILSWQSLGHTGETVAEVSYQEFRIEAHLPDDLFAVPPGCKIVEPGEPPTKKPGERRP